MKKVYYEKEERLVTKSFPVDAYLYCDICGKEIPNMTYHWNITTGHHDWFNDSCDSIQDFDVCSAECVQYKLKSYLEDSDGKRKTAYFDLSRDFWSKEKCMEECE